MFALLHIFFVSQVDRENDIKMNVVKKFEKFHFISISSSQIFLLVGFACSSSMAQKQHTTPVPILKQINRHNEDGSYSYGYEAADGSFKIETKTANGEVKGKYGYVDSDGNVREVEYGANQDGFHPTGTGINVAPAAPHNQGSQYPSLAPGEIDDGQYREDPTIYNDPKYNSKPSKAGTNFRFNQNKPSRPAPQQPQYFEENVPAPIPTQAPRPRYEPSFQTAFQQPSYQQPSYRQPSYQQSQPNYFNYQQQQPNYYQQPANNYYQPQAQPQVNIFAGHPAQNLDLNTGSYSVSYGKKWNDFNSHHSTTF